MLTRASFRNFKALKSVDIELSPFTVIVGKNGSGKTSVLQGICDTSLLVKQSARQQGTIWPFFIFGDIRRVFTTPTHGPLQIGLVDVERHHLSLDAQVLPGRRGGEITRFVLGASSVEDEARDGEAKATFLDVAAPHLAPPDEDPFLKWSVLSAEPAWRPFGSVAYLRLDPRIMARASIASSEEPALGDDGEGLASVLNYMAGATPGVIQQILEDLRGIVPQVSGIRTFPARVSRVRQDHITINNQVLNHSSEEQVMGQRFALEMGPGRLVPADLLSEGTVLVLGLLTALRHPQGPRLILMDDIDRALHSTAQAELVRCLRAILASRPEVQVICTSHSPDLLDEVALEEVRVMALDKEGHARCGKLIDHPESGRWREMLRTGEFWASVGEDWLLETPANG